LESFADTTGHEENNGSLHLNHLLPVTGQPKGIGDPQSNTISVWKTCQ
jgi:hypothetical protein